jgi:hypothetical protein
MRTKNKKTKQKQIGTQSVEGRVGDVQSGEVSSTEEHNKNVKRDQVDNEDVTENKEGKGEKKKLMRKKKRKRMRGKKKREYPPQAETM